MNKVENYNFSSLSELFESAANEHSDKTAFTFLVGNDWKEVSYKDFHDEIIHLSQWLKLKGLGLDDKLVMIAESRYEWLTFLVACSYCNITMVPIDAKLSVGEAASLIDFVKPRMVVLTSKTENLINDCVELLNCEIDDFIVINEVGATNFLAELPKWKHQKLIKSDMNARRLVIFTSGTFSNPKGAEIIEHNIVLSIKSAMIAMITDQKETALSILPMNHIFEMIAGLSTAHVLGDTICIASNLEKDHLFKCFNDKKITRMCAVPLFLRSIYQGLRVNIDNLDLVKKTVFKFMFFISKYCSKGKRRKLFKSIHEKFGGEFSVVVSGGAPLGTEIIEFFDRIGITVLEGYGLTETCATTTANLVDHRKYGSVGKAMFGVEIKIEPSSDKIGEIYVKGVSLMKGYLNNVESTKSSLTEDGWFKTGDLGYVDEDGYLFITGRKKKMIALEGGKKVYSEEIEAFFNEQDYILECCVIPPDKYLNTTEKQMNEFGLAVVANDFAIESYPDFEKLKSFVAEQVKEASQGLSYYKRPRRIFLILGELPKTATLKVKPLEVAKLIQSTQEVSEEII